jgi:hypothetical protein
MTLRTEWESTESSFMGPLATQWCPPLTNTKKLPLYACAYVWSKQIPAHTARWLSWWCFLCMKSYTDVSVGSCYTSCMHNYIFETYRFSCTLLAVVLLCMHVNTKLLSPVSRQLRQPQPVQSPNCHDIDLVYLYRTTMSLVQVQPST